MHARHIVGLVLAIVTIPFLLLGLIDPMEGGLAMVVGGGLLLVTWLVSRIPVPRLEWGAWAATAVVGAAAVTAGMVLWQAGVTGPGLPVPWWVWALIGGYEVGVLCTVAGGVQYLARHVKAVRHHEPTNPQSAVHA